jgi:hypothetical protein
MGEHERGQNNQRQIPCFRTEGTEVVAAKPFLWAQNW